MQERLTRLLIYLGWVLGAAVIFYGFWRYWTERSIPPLLVSLAVLVAGPLEDLLKRWIRHRRRLGREEPGVVLVDAATSVAFLILLLWTIALIP